MNRKRKLCDENRKYNVNWENDFFHVMVSGNLTCLICQKIMRTIKGSNVKRHYEEQHYEFHEFQAEIRLHKIYNLKKSLTDAQDFFKKTMLQPSNIVKASFSVSQLIAKKLKPFTDGEYIKEAALCLIRDVIPEKENLVQNVSLSRHTVVNRISEISQNIIEILIEKISNFEAFSLCLDESTDMTDNAQLAIFIRGADKNLQIYEELLNLQTLNHTTKGTDIFDAFWRSFTDFKLSASLLCGVATDGAKAMVGNKKGFLGILNKKMADLNIDSSNLYIFHCLIHQENLCSKILQMDHVMDLVIKLVNLIRSHATSHRKFQQYLIELDSEYGDIVYFSNVRWLSRGKCLRRFLELKNEIYLFLKLENLTFPELTDTQWLTDLCFLVDICEHLNKLNLELQGENILIVTSCRAIKVFKLKLSLWKTQLLENDATHFHELNNFYIAEKNVKKYAHYVENLAKEFDRRFKEISKYEKNFEIFSSPFTVDVITVPSDLQMEILDLQCQDDLKNIFSEYDGSSKIEFYKKYISETKYPNLKRHAIRIICAFGSSYLCESFFSKMKICKNKNRTRLLDKNMENQLRIATTKIEIDLNLLSQKKDKQNSH